jgi:DNA-binding PadR family transcriptional regulator
MERPAPPRIRRTHRDRTARGIARHLGRGAGGCARSEESSRRCSYFHRVYSSGILGLVAISHTLLGLLEQQASHGYDLKQEYDRRFGATRPLRFNQVYRTLTQLERAGQVIELGLEPGAGPDRRRYEITPDGVTDLDRWLAEPEVPQPQLQAVLFTKVVLALMSGRPAAAYLDAQRARHLAVMREVTASRRAAATTGEALLADFQLFHLEADLRWIDHAAARLEALADEARRGVTR